MKGLLPAARPGAAAVGLLCAGLLAACGVVAQASQVGAVSHAGSVTSGAPQLHVSGNRLVSAHSKAVVLHGVDRSGGEFACVQGWGIWDGPMNQASVTAMKEWGVNAVRVPLNEACWNGESYVKPQFRGANYRRAVGAYVRLLNRNGMVAILDLHWTDGAYSGPSAGCEAGGWGCWLRGGTACAGILYRVAGMQSLVSVIRSTGAHNVIMLGGLAYANDLTWGLRHKPRDPDHNLAASWHSYNFNACDVRSCWAGQVAPVMARVPLIAGEIGENSCSDTYITPLMRW